MKNKLFLALILIAFLVTGCFSNNLKKHLQSIGFDCRKIYVKRLMNTMT